MLITLWSGTILNAAHKFAAVGGLVIIRTAQGLPEIHSITLGHVEANSHFVRKPTLMDLLRFRTVPSTDQGLFRNYL